MPEYSVEAESSLEGFENYKNDCINIIDFLGHEKLPFIAIKCTGLMDINLLKYKLEYLKTLKTLRI